MIIQAGVLITVDDDNRLLSGGSLLIDGDTITHVSERRLSPRSGELVIEAGDAVVMPGLVNTHTHLFQTLLRAAYDHLPLEEYLRYVYACGLELTSEDSRTAAELGCLEALRSGSTTVVDHHFLNRGSELAAATIEGMLGVGCRAVLARTLMDTGQGLPDEIKETPEAAFRSVDELTTAFAGSIREAWLHVMTGPNTPGINASEAACREIAEFAASRGIRQSAHVAEYRGVRDRVKADYGVDGVVRWLDQLGVLGDDLLAVHAVQVDSDELMMLAEAGASVSHNPFSNLFCGDKIARVDDMLFHGTTVGLGTDGAANNNGQGIFDVARITRSLQRLRPSPNAITATDALRMATIDGAKAIGLSSRIGSLEEGKLADIIILDTSKPHMKPFLKPVEHVAAFAKGTDVRMVIVGGRIVLQDGTFTDLDEAATLNAAQRAGQRLLTRLG